MSENSQHSSNWSSSFGFILACVGSAVGLGNLWKFPYITYENGGGAFVLVYLGCILVVGLPIILAEMMIGRHGKLDLYGTFKKLSNNNWFWKGLGLICLLNAFLILSFYSVVAGWTLDYFLNSISGNLAGLSIEEVGPRFGGFVGDSTKQVLFHTIFMALTMGILIKGTKGIEKAVKVLMPVLFILVCIVMFLSIYRYGAGESLAFLFTPDFSKITGHGVLEALGHAFFTMSLGLGVMIVYGSYLPKNVNIVKAGIAIGVFDTIIALMACMMMYPIILGNDMELSESASMLFTSLTVQFHTLPGGQYVSAIFYLLIAFAALSSTISLLEPVVSFISEEFKFKRLKATLLGAFLVWLVGLFSALSNGANDFFTGLGVMDKLDYITSNWGLPIGGLLISIFAGWYLSKSVQLEELDMQEGSIHYKTWLACAKYISPLLIIIVMLFKIGIIG